MKADEIRRDTRPWEFWLKECAYQLALANERGTAEPEAPMTCRSCNASTRDFKPYPCCGHCGAMLRPDAVSEPEAQEDDTVTCEGCDKLATMSDGEGNPLCADCLALAIEEAKTQPPDASAGECAGADVVTAVDAHENEGRN